MPKTKKRKKGFKKLEVITFQMLFHWEEPEKCLWFDICFLAK